MNTGAATQALPRNSSGFQIEHRCPQCGAPALLEDTDRLFRCGFCRVSSCLVPGSGFRYMLPHRVAVPELLQVPYWRLRGMLFTMTPTGVQHRVVDASLKAAPHDPFPDSLGIRPQAMKLRFATPEAMGRFVRSVSSASEMMTLLGDRFGADGPARNVCREFIGETLSLIYAPFYVNGGLFDAVLGKVVTRDLPDDFASTLPAEPAAPPDVTFIPALCPNCGCDLEGERNALVYVCRQCASTWALGQRSLEATEFVTLPGADESSVLLPFWRIEAELKGIDSASYADLVRVTNLPRVIMPRWEEESLRFWIPAFKIRPEVFLRLATSFTVSRPGDGRARELPARPTHPVTLPIAEAVASARWVLARLALPSRTMFAQLAGTQARSRNVSLAYVPFRQSGNELTHPVYPITLEKGALQLGLEL